jgi:hypothetical protein
LLAQAGAAAQNATALKAGVVRIENSRFAGEVGSGFIVSIDGERVYIVTAAHVVKGAQNHRVFLYSRQHEPISAEVLNRQLDDTKGLALLLLRADARTASGLTALKFGPSEGLGNGEPVKIVGFPGTSIWTVENSSIKRLDGNDLVLSGQIRGGDSGGPVILNQEVVGLVTDVSEPDAYASRGEIVATYINGIEKNLVAPPGGGPRPDAKESKDEFCQTLLKLLDSSKGGFYSIVGDATNSENTFYPSVMMPGAAGGYVLPKERVYYYLLITSEKGKAERQYFETISKLRVCLPSWEEKEESNSYSFRYYKFKESKGDTVVNVNYNLTPQNSGTYYLTLSIDLSHKGYRIW